MRTLLILRHGAAVREGAGSDHERALTADGAREAEQMGQLLRDEQLVPDAILSSNALRARQTAQRVARACRCERSVADLAELYLAEPDAYITALKRVAGDAERVLVVGHNPGLEALALLLTGTPVSLPTAGLAVCALPISNFSELSLAVTGELSRFERPRNLAD